MIAFGIAVIEKAVVATVRGCRRVRMLDWAPLLFRAGRDDPGLSAHLREFQRSGAPGSIDITVPVVPRSSSITRAISLLEVLAIVLIDVCLVELRTGFLDGGLLRLLRFAQLRRWLEFGAGLALQLLHQFPSGLIAMGLLERVAGRLIA